MDISILKLDWITTRTVTGITHSDKSTLGLSPHAAALPSVVAFVWLFIVSLLESWLSLNTGAGF